MEAGKLAVQHRIHCFVSLSDFVGPALNLIGEQIEMAAAAEGEAERLLKG